MRVLICDDEVLISRDLAESLNGAGFETVYLGNVRTAESYARRERPEFAIVDLGFPDGGSGLALARLCDELGIRVIVISGAASSPPELGHFAQTFISKPVPHQVVLDVLERARHNTPGQRPMRAGFDFTGSAPAIVPAATTATISAGRTK